MIVERKDKTADFDKFRDNLADIDWGHKPTKPVAGRRTVKVYGAGPPQPKSNLTFLGIPRRSEPTVIRQDLLADWMKDNA